MGVVFHRFGWSHADLSNLSGYLMWWGGGPFGMESCNLSHLGWHGLACLLSLEGNPAELDLGDEIGVVFSSFWMEPADVSDLNWHGLACLRFFFEGSPADISTWLVLVASGREWGCLSFSVLDGILQISRMIPGSTGWNLQVKSSVVSFSFSRDLL